MSSNASSASSSTPRLTPPSSHRPPTDLHHGNARGAVRKDDRDAPALEPAEALGCPDVAGDDADGESAGDADGAAELVGAEVADDLAVGVGVGVSAGVTSTV